MKRIPTFLAGILTAAVIGGLGVGALAASGAVSFNASALQLNGRQISAKGENYTLASGQQVPASITYTDETGGGTTYLPVRRIAELLGIEIGWDNATGSVTVTGDVKPTATPDPDTTPSTDYSDWTAEEEAAYQEFKEIIELTKNENMDIFAEVVEWCGVEVNTRETDMYIAIFGGEESWKYEEAKSSFEKKWLPLVGKYGVRYIEELHVDGRNTRVVFGAGHIYGYEMMQLKNGDIVVDAH